MVKFDLLLNRSTNAPRKEPILTRFEVLSLRNALERHQEFSAVISIENANGNYRSLEITDGRPHLTLQFNDIDFDDGSDLIATRSHLEQALTFFERFKSRGEGDGFLIHCHAGRCRSPAIALLLLANEFGKGREEDAVQELLDIVPGAAPTTLVLKLADEALGRNGALIDAWEPYEQTDAIKRVRVLKQEIYDRIRRNK